MTDPNRNASPMVRINVERMRRRRQLQGFSQTKLAEIVGVDNSYISRIESGHRPTVSPKTLINLCDALGIEDREELIADGSATSDDDEAAA